MARSIAGSKLPEKNPGFDGSNDAARNQVTSVLACPLREPDAASERLTHGSSDGEHRAVPDVHLAKRQGLPFREIPTRLLCRGIGVWQAKSAKKSLTSSHQQRPGPRRSSGSCTSR